MLPGISEDLVEEILSMVPATTLKRLRSICKQWNVLINDRKFIQKHISKRAKENMIVMLNDFKVYSLAINLHGICKNFYDPSIMVRRKPSMINFRDEKLSVLYHTLDPFEIEIWVTNEIKPNFVSWSKFFTMDMMKFQTTYDLWSFMNFCIDEEKEVVVLHCAKYLKELANATA
ncbi:unnamed protein product [Cochlearia groenlandica]